MSRHDRDKQNRRRRAREAIEALRVRVRRICGRVGDIDSILDEIAPIARQIRAFAEGPQGRELVPDRERRILLDAAKQLERARGRIDTLADACNLVQNALQDADEAILDQLATESGLGGNGDGTGKLLRRVLGGTVLGGAVIVAVAAFLVVGGDDNCFDECFDNCLSESSDPEFPDREGCTTRCEEECPSTGEILHDLFFTADVQQGPRTFLSRAPPTSYALQA